MKRAVRFSKDKNGNFIKYMCGDGLDAWYSKDWYYQDMYFDNDDEEAWLEYQLEPFVDKNVKGRRAVSYDSEEYGVPPEGVEDCDEGFILVCGIPWAMREPLSVTEIGTVEWPYTNDADVWRALYDFELNYDLSEKRYFFFFEMLMWPENGWNDFMHECLNALEFYMVRHGYDTNVYLNVWSAMRGWPDDGFKNIETAYAWLRMLVYGVHK